jgi:DNA polymerase-3 subunit gamma/tau
MDIYKKYRPETFDEVIGNEEIVDAMKEMVSDLDKCPHTFLFHGPTGCGKTTLGRILANELGVDSVDLYEINSADFRGIDSARELIKKSKFQPMNGDVRVWIIDEVHKMTNDAQTAILKLLEDTPEDAYYILCTTHPQSLIKAIRGRCIEFEVSLLDEKQMSKLIKGVTKQEKDKLDAEVVERIVTDAAGHPRNALQILSKVLQVSPEKRLKAAEQSQVLESESIELARALLKKEPWKKIRAILTQLKGQDAESIRRVVLGYCQSILLNSDNEQAAAIIEEFWEPTYNIGFPGIVYMSYAVYSA